MEIICIAIFIIYLDFMMWQISWNVIGIIFRSVRHFVCIKSVSRHDNQVLNNGEIITNGKYICVLW